MSGQVESKIQMEVVAPNYLSHSAKHSFYINEFNRERPVMHIFPIMRVFGPNKRLDIITFDNMYVWIISLSACREPAGSG